MLSDDVCYDGRRNNPAFMTIRMRDDILANQITYYNGLIAKHKQNVEIYLNNPVGIGEHLMLWQQ